MLNSQRTFVNAVKRYCEAHGIDVEIRSQGWLVVMKRGPKRHMAFGYDVGLNSAVSHRIANDKSATAEVLQSCGVACVPHTLFLSPVMNKYVPPQHSWEGMLRLLHENPGGLVVKPNEGTSGQSVFRVSTVSDLELAVHRIFSTHPGLAVSPYLAIEEEIRVVLVDRDPVAVYSKDRPSVVGDGQRSVLELVLATTPPERRSSVLQALAGERDKTALDEIVPQGERRSLNWRHNLEFGAEPVLLEHGAARAACIEIALAAAAAIDLRFASVDVVRVEGAYRILEVNSGVMMEALGRRHPELVDAAYGKALDKVFAEP